MKNTEVIAALSKKLFEQRNFSKNGVSGHDAMRNAFYEVLEVPVGTTGSALFTAFNKNKWDFYAVINSAVEVLLPTIITNQFDGFAETHQINTNDKKVFTVKQKQLFPVSVVARGTKDLNRHKLENGRYTIDTDTYGIKVYAEFHDFLSGRIDWNDYLESIALSFANHIGERIVDAMASGYDGLRARFKAQGSGKFSVDEVARVARAVSAANGGVQVRVYGTIGALSNIDTVELSERMKDEKNTKGYIARVRGLDLVPLPDAVNPATEEFRISDKTLTFIPGSEKIVDVVIEGQPITVDTEAGARNDMQLEFTTLQEYGVHIKQAASYGMYQLT